MKILVGGFVAESNARVQKPCAWEDFMYKYDEAVTKALYVDALFEKEGIEAIPTIYADGRAAGRVTREAFDFIAHRMVQSVRDHVHEIDGIFLFLHGASNVLDLEGGSGEHVIVREIRKIVGPYLPIAMITDPHGNISQEIVEQCQIVRTFRHSPHTDRVESHQLVAKMLIDVLRNRRDIRPVYRKVPIILGGERCVSTDEPLISINHLLDEIEADERILSCSYHIGYVRHDNPNCGASIVVVPQTPQDTQYAKQQANRIYDFVWQKRRTFHFTGNALEPEEALAKAIAFQGTPVVMTDSGDNCTAGGPGCNTYVLKQFLATPDLNGKRVLFACIADEKCAKQLSDQNVGDYVSISLGAHLDALSSPVPISGIIQAKGECRHHYGETHSVGTCSTIAIEGTTIEVIVAEKAVAFAEQGQYEAAGVDIHAYDLIVVKQGYIYPQLKALATYSVMSLTDGATNQRTEKIRYQTILRPMYPIDDI